MLTTSEVIAFAGARDLDRARAFYADVLGLRLVEQNDFACVFATGASAAMLRVTAVPQVVVAGYTVLGWRVSDIAAEVDELFARGVTFHRYPGLMQDERGIWTTPGGDQVAWFADPDGNTLSLTQFT
jgi:catechol 2,3-dioxygenase-like lactoylglutathione lyase family enzyme